MNQNFLKFIRTATFLSILTGLGILTSCGGEDEPLITPPAPTISIEQGTQSSAYPGETLVLSAVVNGNATIVQADVYRDQVNIASYPLDANFQTFTIPEVEYTIPESDAGQVVTFTFEARDENDKTATAEYNLTVLAETPMAYDSVGAILGSKIGVAPSAWSLVSNERLGKDAAGADMQNPSIGTGTVEQQWIKGWDGESSTTFVKANNFDYENATVEAAAATFADGTPTAEVRNVAVGDIYIANMRGAGNYAVIQVAAVSENIVNEETNTERILFNYKKETETAGQ